MRSINLHFAPLFDKDIAAITHQDIKDIIGKISGNAIAARMQDLLQSILKYAIEQGYVKENVADGLPKIEQKHGAAYETFFLLSVFCRYFIFALMS